MVKRTLIKFIAWCALVLALIVGFNALITNAARTEGVWDVYTGYIRPSNPGYDVLVYGSNRYLNFGIASGSTGYGFRDNAGTIECKNSGGSWTACAGGSSSITGLIQAGTNITITGSGTSISPYVINSTGGGGSQDLQSVTNIGFTTTTPIWVDSLQVADLSAAITTASHSLTVGETLSGGTMATNSTASIAGGYSSAPSGTSSISTNDLGSFAFGYSIDGTIFGKNRGSSAFGYVENGGYLASEGDGSSATGYSVNSSQIYTNSNGGRVSGFADNSGIITSQGRGATSGGYSNGATIEALNDGDFAGGFATAGETIKASGRGSFAYGVAENNGSLESSGYGSITLGDGIRNSGTNAIALGRGYSTGTGDILTVGFGAIDMAVGNTTLLFRALSGTGTEMVVADPSGNLSRQPIPSPGTGTVTSVTGTADRITISGTPTVAPIVDIAATYVGQSSITTLGTITTGTWQGTPIANAYLANSTISGISLGSNLADLTATNTTLTFSGSYNGGTARTVGLNLANANSWTGAQSFNNIIQTEAVGSDIVVDGGFAIPTQYTAATSGVNIGTETITLSSNPGWAVGDTVAYYNGGGTTMAGLLNAASYFIISNSGGVIQVSTTSGGAAVNLTGTGNNAQYFIKTNWFAGTGGTTGGVAGWSLNAGVAAKDIAGTAILVPSVALTPTVGTLYKVQYTISNWTAAGMTVVFGGVTLQANTQPTANGTFSFYVTAQTTGSLQFNPVTAARYSIDNVSIQPVTSGITSTLGTSLLFNKTLSGVGNENAMHLNYIVNKTSGNDTGLFINKTNIASTGTSLLVDMQLNNATRFSVTDAGAVTATSFNGNLVGGTLTATTGAFTGTVSTTQSLTTTPTNGFSMTAPAALVGTPVRISSSTLWSGTAWNTTPTAASKINAIEAYLLPVTGATTSGSLIFANRTVDGSANSTEIMRLATSGFVGFGGTDPTALVDLKRDAIGITQSDTYGINLRNTTASTSGAGNQQWSPPMVFSTTGFSSTGGSQTIKYRLDARGVNVSGASSTGNFVIANSLNGGSYTDVFTITPLGGVTIGITTVTSLTSGAMTASGVITHGRLTFTNTTSTDGIVSSLAGLTVDATAGNPIQYSPRIRLQGRGWTGAASQLADWTEEVRPTTGTSPITSNFFWSAQINSAGYSDLMSITSGGLLGVNIGANTVATSTIQSGGSFAAATRNITGNRTLDVTDYAVFCNTSGGGFTVTLPTAVGISGRTYQVVKTSASNTLTFATTSAQTINGAAPGAVTALGTTTFISDGANWWIL